MFNIDKTTLNMESERTGFIRDNLEKVYRLLNVLEFINSNELLRGSLVLKGGTAINLTLSELPRLSVDIDLDFHRKCSRDEMMKSRGEIESLVGRYMTSNGYTYDDNRGKAVHALGSGVYTYQNIGGNRDNIKIEINYSMRLHILEPVTREVRFDFMKSPVTIRTLDKNELYGSKIKALLERTAARDLFDINNAINNRIFENVDLEMLKKCVLFYKTVGCTGSYDKTISLDNVDNLTFTKIRQTLLPVLRKSEYVDLQGMKENARTFLSELLVLSDKEVQYLNEFGRGFYRPELLFDDADILGRIDNHPMALWKTSRMREEPER